MQHKPASKLQRELWMTSAVRHFLERYGKTDSAKQLSNDIVYALGGRDEKNGCIRLTAPTFLLFIIDAAEPGGQERVVVWHGPSDGGAFFNEAILQKTVFCGMNLM